ncbi:MAG: tetratricopeptide repeat protein [Bacteroidota bacterium]|nr:tetratricopeptide repeat protein [Bacteroidota bacterium]
MFSIDLSTKKVDSLNSLAYSYLNTQLNLTERYSYQALKSAKSIAYLEGTSEAYFNLGMSSYVKGNYFKAFDFFSQAIKDAEKVNYVKGEADGLIGLGIVYQEQQELKKSLDYLYKCLYKYKSIKYKKGEGHAYNMIGLSYYKMDDYATSNKYYDSCLTVANSLKDDALLVSILQDYGNLYAKQKEYLAAIDILNQSLEVANRIPSNYHMCFSNVAIGRAYLGINEINKAEDAFKKVITIAEESNMKPFLESAYEGLSLIYKQKNNPALAYEYLVIYNRYRDTLFNKQIANEISKLSYVIDSERKSNHLAMVMKDNELQKKSLENRKLEQIFLISAVVLLLILGVVVLNRYSIKNKANTNLLEKNKEILFQQQELENYTQALEEQSKELKIQKEKISNIHKDITDSIEYAKGIQQAILPSITDFFDAFNEIMFIYQPKDIVSGDFYWFQQVENKYYFAVADCTGHGIPGAFMSLLGLNNLNQIIEENKIYDVAEILTQLDTLLVKALKQRNKDAFSNDGMDIALCCFNKDNLELEYASAKRPFYYFSNNELQIIPSSRVSVGGIDIGHKAFAKQTIQLNKDDVFYLFTDGFADQFGGEHNRKLSTARFKTLLKEIHSKPLIEQKIYLTNFFDAWKGDNEQIDDVLVLGLKI